MNDVKLPGKDYRGFEELFPNDIDVIIDAMRTQHQLITTVKPRQSEDAPTTNQYYLLCDLYRNIYPVLLRVQELQEALEGEEYNYMGAMHEIGEIIRVYRTNPTDFDSWLKLNFPTEYEKHG